VVSEFNTHFLVPKHVIVPKELHTEILTTLGTSLDQLPVILKTDAAVKPMKVKRDDIIKVVRDSPTAGKTIFYRRVF
jgi:DNA-directed RNA polymerase subunit H